MRPFALISPLVPLTGQQWTLRFESENEPNHITTYFYDERPFCSNPYNLPGLGLAANMMETDRVLTELSTEVLITMACND